VSGVPQSIPSGWRRREGGPAKLAYAGIRFDSAEDSLAASNSMVAGPMISAQGSHRA
jgi:hypothetical protein